VESSSKGKRGRPKGTAANRIFEVIEGRVLRLELRPGEEISEAAIVKEFGVSRTPVREALVRMAASGLVEVLPNQSARVVPLRLEQTFETLEALELAQRTVNRWAASNRTAEDIARIEQCHAAFKEAALNGDVDALVDNNFEFHSAIGQACGNSIIAEFNDVLLRRCLRLARMILAKNEWGRVGADRYGHVFREHDELIEALRTGDGDAAEKNGAEHARRFRDAVVAYVDRGRASEVSIPDARKDIVS